MKENDNESDESFMEYLDNDINNDKTELDLTNEESKLKPIVLGIDLGTTNSCISIWRNNNCEIIPDEYGNKTIPSYVSYTNVTKYVGHEAKKQQDINAENVFYEVKRLIGRSYNEKTVQDHLKFLSYNVVENDRGAISLQSTIRNNKMFTPEEISASVLQKLKDMAQKYLKREIKDVVITVPAQFNDAQRQATKNAAEIAGLNCIRMFHEPTAAALAYGMIDRSINANTESKNDDLESKDSVDSESDKKGITALVYDFGGGTLDVNIIDIYNGVFDVLGTAGITKLGGVDFDNRIMNFCLATFSRKHYGAKKLDHDKINRLSLQKLRIQCESAKKILSTNVNAIIAIENFHDEKDMFVKINRTDFENLCRDLFLLCLHPIDEILEECGKTETDIDEVILVGGMTRMPYIREMLNNRFRLPTGVSKVNCSINPDEAVSVGAALQGYILANKDDPFSDSVTLMDVTPLSLGVEVIGGVMDVLISRNTMIPCEKTRLYSTDTDYVDSVLIKIFEGERTMTNQNFKVGEFELDKIPIEQRGIPEIEVTFAIDINGIVTVSALEKDVNEQKSIIVNTNKNGLKPHEIQALIDEAIEQETTDEIDRVKKYSYYELEDLCSNITSNINNKEFKLTKRDIQTVQQDVEHIKSWLKEKTYKEREIDDFKDAVYNMKVKYGVLILQGKLEDSKVKAVAEQLEATTLYGKEDDEEEEDMKQAFEKANKDEMGVVEGMSDSEIIEIKDMRDALMELCKTVCGIISSGKLNIDTDHKREMLNYIDDTMMWYYSHEKPTKIDYKEKIDFINTLCNELVNRYDSDGKELFDKCGLERDIDTESQKLEKLCLTIITMMNNKQIYGSKASLALLNVKLKNVLKFVYTKGESLTSNLLQTLDDSTPNSSLLTEEEFQAKCTTYIDEINKMCDDVYDNIQSISIVPVVSISKQSINAMSVVTDEFTEVDKTNDDQDQGGMSILELMRLKQNEEIDEAIDKMINDSSNDEKM